MKKKNRWSFDGEGNIYFWVKGGVTSYLICVIPGELFPGDPINDDLITTKALKNKAISMNLESVPNEVAYLIQQRFSGDQIKKMGLEVINSVSLEDDTAHFWCRSAGFAFIATQRP